MAKAFHQKGLEKEWMGEAMKHKQPWELNSPRSEDIDFAADNRWYYTFWNRRQTEGNDAKVLEILREVREHYR